MDKWQQEKERRKRQEKEFEKFVWQSSIYSPSLTSPPCIPFRVNPSPERGCVMMSFLGVSRRISILNSLLLLDSSPAYGGVRMTTMCFSGLRHSSKLREGIRG